MSHPASRTAYWSSRNEDQLRKARIPAQSTNTMSIMGLAHLKGAIAGIEIKYPIKSNKNSNKIMAEMAIPAMVRSFGIRRIPGVVVGTTTIRFMDNTMVPA